MITQTGLEGGGVYALSPHLRGAIEKAGEAILTVDLLPEMTAADAALTGVAPITHAISSAGGVPFDELDNNFMVKRKPGLFVAGEMLDWEAPTGGYLLQAGFATGFAAGEGAARWLERRG